MKYFPIRSGSEALSPKICGQQMNSGLLSRSIDSQKGWRCPHRPCRNSHGLRKDSFFDQSKLQLWQIISLVHSWCQSAGSSRGLSYDHIMDEASIGGKATVVDWMQFCRDVAVENFLRHPCVIGGEGVIVQVGIYSQNIISHVIFNDSNQSFVFWCPGISYLWCLVEQTAAPLCVSKNSTWARSCTVGWNFCHVQLDVVRGCCLAECAGFRGSLAHNCRSCRWRNRLLLAFWLFCTNWRRKTLPFLCMGSNTFLQMDCCKRLGNRWVWNWRNHRAAQIFCWLLRASIFYVW